MIAKCNINLNINKYKKRKEKTPKSSESFIWKNVNWKKNRTSFEYFPKQNLYGEKRTKYKTRKKISKVDLEFI